MLDEPAIPSDPSVRVRKQEEEKYSQDSTYYLFPILTQSSSNFLPVLIPRSGRGCQMNESEGNNEDKINKG